MTVALAFLVCSMTGWGMKGTIYANHALPKDFFGFFQLSTVRVVLAVK